MAQRAGGDRIHPGHAQLTAGAGGAQPSAEWRQVYFSHTMQPPVRTQLLLQGHTAGYFASMARAQSPTKSAPNSAGIFTPSAPRSPVPSHVQRRYTCPVPSSTPSSGKGALSPDLAVIATSENCSFGAHASHAYIARTRAPPSSNVVSARVATTAFVGPNQEPSHVQPRQICRSQSPPTSPVRIFQHVGFTAQGCSHTLPRHSEHARTVVVPPAPSTRAVVTVSECSHIQPLQACITPSPIPGLMLSPLQISSGTATPIAALADQRRLHLQSKHTCHTPSPLPRALDAVMVVGAAAPEESDQELSHVARQGDLKPGSEGQEHASAQASHTCHPSVPMQAVQTEGSRVVPNTNEERDQDSPQALPRRTCHDESEILEAGTAASFASDRSCAQPRHASPLTSSTRSSRSNRKVSSLRASSFDSGELSGRGGIRTASASSVSTDKAAPFAHKASPKQCAKSLSCTDSPVVRSRRVNTCRDSPDVGSRRVRNAGSPRRGSVPAARECGRPSLYPRLGSDGSCIIRPMSGFRDKRDLNTSLDTGSAEDVLQRSVDRRADFSSTSAQLLSAWMRKRHTTESLSAEEADLVKEVIFETMPSDKAKIMRIDRMMQPELIRSFCREEVESITRERENQRKHKEFMFLHGTRWENVPLICSMGLDPDCGHLSKGSWLGQSAEAAHAYASKGPGPGPFHDGHRLFAMFVVACLPSYADGDEERSFGVWRIMSSKRMCPAYLVIYSAPQSMRVQRQSRHTSRSPSPETLLQPCHGRLAGPVNEPGKEATTGSLGVDSSPENHSY
eukprot:TRINITY_DN30549_c0_g1_i1.p1 TRINITY_DN30549_c0_g1~~TRINITY_DN30549_c0_g1_i1.p1  ORF type:complete len:792 (-),score=71.08 TRINITY_DN30549_c0_g1_i1:227-2602(-)